MKAFTLIALVPLLPLLSFLVSGLWGRKYLKNFSGVLGTLAIAASAGIAFFIAYQYFFVSGQVDGVYEQITVLHYTWLEFSPGLSIDMGLLLDPVSVMMIVVVTFISLMVHVYSLGYMKGEARFSTYYAYLSLFTFSMLGLVLSGNIFQIYMFWELVGVSSFLLIGFYYDKPSAVAAAKKAFIVTRFADLGFLIGILILAFYAHTLDFGTLIERLTTHTEYYASITAASFLGVSALSWGLVLVFIGGAGKSAMFPLHIWLPDAMEGPTPVSALIHAATMVVAGVFLVARLFPVYALSCLPALEVVTYVGAFSAFFAAIIACTQTDIKRVLAYSTMSQIGYMMFALGVSGYGGENGLGYTASLFHLFTHAMFKALLFLGAGAVIHYVHSNELKDMGGLRKQMPVTHLLFLAACLAIAGIPPFAGFFSKEEILTATWNSNKLVFGVALLTSAITAFYMFRLYFSIFWNKNREANAHDDHHHSSEAPGTMLLPMILLGLCTIAAGFVPFGEFVSSDGTILQTEIHFGFSAVPVGFALIAILLAMRMYRCRNAMPDRIAGSLGGIYRAAHRKFYIDEIYLAGTKKFIFGIVGASAAWFDRNIVDGMMNLLGTLTAWISGLVRPLQSGKLQHYAFYFFFGVIGFVILLIFLTT